MTDIRDLLPEPGERHLLFGGMRSGKSSLADWCDRSIRQERPECMALLLDSKPRFRAEKMQGLTPKSRRSASQLYKDWASGPVVPNSVVLDFTKDRPFRGLWNEPGELVIMQSGKFADHVRMLYLLDAFIEKSIKDRERLVEVDEGLDFTGETRTALFRALTQSRVRREPAASGTSGFSFAPREYSGFRRFSVTMRPESHCSTFAQMLTCDICSKTEYLTPSRRKVTIYFTNGRSRQAASSQTDSGDVVPIQTNT